MTASVHGVSANQVLTLSCPDRTGIVHAVAGAVLAAGGNIAESHQYGDPGTGRFFMRVEVAPSGDAVTPVELGAALRLAFAPVASGFGMDWQLHPADHRTRTLILVSLGGHCLHDLLFRSRSGTLPVDVPAVVVATTTTCGRSPSSTACRSTTCRSPPDTKAAAEARLLDLVKSRTSSSSCSPATCRCSPTTLCTELAGRAINIHHSFLPSFKGARPYHQAHERGVKLIGATAHYVTARPRRGADHRAGRRPRRPHA